MKKNLRLTRSAGFAILLMVFMITACAPLNQPSATNAVITEIVTEPTVFSSPTLFPLSDGLEFEEGKYTRDQFCGRIFNFQKTTHGLITIAIADKLLEPHQFQGMAEQIISIYRDLYTHSPVPMGLPLTVYVISNPDQGDCYSADQVVFVSPEGLENRTFMEELFGVGTGIADYWVRVGLVSLAMGEQTDEATLAAWYKDKDDLDMVGLFYARFVADWANVEEIQIARLSAASLVKYAIEVEGIRPELLVEQVDNQVRSRWMAALGVDRPVTYPYDGQFTSFRFSHQSNCSLYVQTDTINFCLNRLPEIEYFDEVSEAEFILSNTYYGHQALVEYIQTEAPSVSHLMDSEEIISFRIIDQGAACGTADGNDVSVNNSSIYYLPLPRIVSTFNWIPLLSGSIWIEDGFVEYLGKYIPIYEQTEKRAIFDDLNGRLYSERFDGTETAQDKAKPTGTSYWYLLDLEQLAAAKTWYLAQGGQMDSESAIDPLLFADAVAFATMDQNAYGGLRSITFSELYSSLNKYSAEQNLDGMELSYTQAASFLGYLADRYTLDRVLDVYVNQAEEGLLDGRTYQELKSEWQAYLLSKSEGVAIPGE